jgi:hypothetical protein
MTNPILTRFATIGSVIAAVLFTTAGTAWSQSTAQPECETLFVQNARSVSMEGDTLILEGVSPLISFFCDRPVRHAGHVTNDEYLQAWDAGKDSFADDPPNAMVSVLDGDDAHDVVVELLGKPAMDGDRFTYKIAIIEGEPVSADTPASMFIDIIGRPLTPMSYAGVGRRTTRRVVRRCAVGVTCW